MLGNVNKVVCDGFLKGKCDHLSKNPKNYTFTFIISLIFTYAFPLFMVGITFLISYRNDIASSLFYFFSPFFPGAVSLYFASNYLAIIILGAIVVIINGFYVFYMGKQLGIFMIIPFLAEATKWIIIIFLNDWYLVAIIISLLPIMPIAVGSHFTDRLMNKGIIVRK